MKNYYGVVSDLVAKDNLNKVDYVLRYYNDNNKDKVQYKSEIRGFCGDYLEIGIRFAKDYVVYKKIMVEDFENSMKAGTCYIVNPCFINRYYKQKWYQNPKA